MEEVLAIRGPDEVRESVRSSLESCQRQLDEIVGQGAEERSVRTVLRPLDRLYRRLHDVSRAIHLLRSVHPSSDVRTAAEDGERELAEFGTSIGLNRDLFEAVRGCDVRELDEAGKRLHSHWLRDFHRSGVDREAEVREEVRRLRRELVRIGQEFSRNIRDDVRTVHLEGPEELEGLPEDYRRSHQAGPDGRIAITTDTPDYHPFMVYARSGARREELYRTFRHRAWPANDALLKELFETRHRLATILEYASWADYAAEDKMIRTGQAIDEFIERVAESALERGRREHGILLARKREDEPGAEEVHDWEKGYYEELVRTEQYRVDSRELRPYFDYAAVREGIFSLSSRLFGVEFRVVADGGAWHEEVEVLDVVEDGRVVGRVYLDMHPRPGKFKHAAMFPLVAGTRDGAPPSACLVCNFARGGDDGAPALMEFDDVVTFFHEFGHLLHHLFGRETDWVEFSGTGTEWDFVEVPSQLFEEWAWEPSVLRGFAVHHETGEVISEDLIARLRRSRDFGRGLWVRQQMFYARLSLECHFMDPSALELDRLQAELQNRYSLFRFVEGTHFHTSFGHLQDYSALYYTYMWSLVIVKDLLGRFRDRGLLDVETARRYRDAILAPGGSRDASDLVRAFLGRAYSFDAFTSWLEGE